MLGPKPKKDEIESSLMKILTEINSLTFQFLTDQEKKQEWESNSVTSQHIQDIREELAKITVKPEFTEHGFDVSPILQAINTDLDMLGHRIKQDEADRNGPRVQRKKQQYETSDRKKFTDITDSINGFLHKLEKDEAHLISPQEVSAVETDLKNLRIDANKKKGLAANLRIVKTQIEKNQPKLDESTPGKKMR